MAASIQRFEDLIAWQKARELTRQVYLATVGERFRRDFGLSAQLQRAAVSVMANIAEGFERKRPTESGHYLGIAKASCAEVSSHLYVALDVGYLEQAEFDSLQERAREISRILSGLRTAVGRPQHRSSQGGE